MPKIKSIENDILSTILGEMKKWLLPLIFVCFLQVFRCYEVNFYGVGDFIYVLKTFVRKILHMPVEFDIEGNVKIFYAILLFFIIFLVIRLIIQKRDSLKENTVVGWIFSAEDVFAIVLPVAFSTAVFSFLWTLSYFNIAVFLKIVSIVIISAAIFINTRQELREKLSQVLDKHHRIYTIIFILSFIEVYYRQFIEDTTLTVLTKNYVLFHLTFFIAIYVMFVLALIKTLTISDDRMRNLVLILLFFAIIYSGIHGNDRNVICFFFTMAAAREEKPEIVLTIGMAENILIMTIGFFLSMNGTISNFNFISYGIINSTNYAAHILIIVMAYCILRKFLLPWYSYAILTFITIMSLHYQHGKTDFVLMILLILLCLVNQLKNLIGKPFPKVPKAILSALIIFAQPVIFAFTYIITYSYYRNPDFWWGTLDKNHLLFYDVVIRQRDMLNSFTSNHVRLMGSTVDERGWGVSNVYKVGENVADKYAADYYSFVDEVPARLLIIGGILLTIIFLVFFIIVSKNLIARGMPCIAVCLALFALQGFMEQFSVRFAFNYVLIAAFMYAVNEKYKTGPELEKSLGKEKESS